MNQPTSPVSQHHLYRALAAAVTDGPPPPHRVNLVLPTAAAPPLVCLDLWDHDDAREWAEHLGITDSGSVHVGRTGTSTSFIGMWLGWRVLLTSDEPTQAAVAEAVLQS